MRILLSNDDGIGAEGLATLAAVACTLGEVKIVAPDREKSACGHGFTMRDPLRLKPVDYHRIGAQWGFDLPAIEAYETNGVPTDCVNLGLFAAWPDGCDLILSGINAGPNLGFDITYSGTVAAAMEGVINRVKSIAISMAIFVDGAPMHFATGESWLRDNLAGLVNLEMPELTFLNVNVPAIAPAEIAGTRVTTMGQRVYAERMERREDPWGRPYYWQGGNVVMRPDQPGTDVKAVSEGYVSVTPVSLDWTRTSLIEPMRELVER